MTKRRIFALIFPLALAVPFAGNAWADHMPTHHPDGTIVYGDWGLYRPGTWGSSTKGRW